MISVTVTRIDISVSEDFLQKMLNWADRFSIFSFLNGHDYPADRSFPLCLAVGEKRSLSLTPGRSFDSLKAFFNQEPSWLFGHISYDLMAETLGVFSRHQPDPVFGYGFFFEPEILIQISSDSVMIQGSEDPHALIREINTCSSETTTHCRVSSRACITREYYLDMLAHIQGHIQRGDCYELNYCIPFHAGKAQYNPITLFTELMRIAPNPFSALYKIHGHYCICASPERFLQKKGRRIISQPMKGTASRSEDPVTDVLNRDQLAHNAKERSENVMIVDLVRNDLSRISSRGSVAVDELFGVYSFPFVHQMVSTVSGMAEEEIHWADILASCFPMGSMTGAPKKRVAELIDLYEPASRGLFSGSIGYVDPSGDFDFNVVIRSLFYNKESKEIKFWAGSGITNKSRAVAEYEECLLKASALIRILEGK